MTVLYSLSGVEKWFGEHRALSVPSLEIPAGGITAVVGPNGSGKTTLLRLLAFVERPTQGSVHLCGEPSLEPVGYVDQSPYLFRGTVASNVAYGLRAARVPRRERRRRAAQGLDDLGLAAIADRRASALSGGERRRVALARVLVLSPSVLLLDEPFAEVDRPRVAEIERLLRDRAVRATVILTTHDLAQAHRLADRVLSLVSGQLSPIPLANTFLGSVRSRAGASLFQTGGLELEVPDGHADATVAAIDPEAVVISTAPVYSSARNRLSGTIVQVESRDGLLYLTVDCGAPLVAAVTRHSYEELRLNVGCTVWVTFKSSAVHLY